MSDVTHFFLSCIFLWHPSSPEQQTNNFNSSGCLEGIGTQQFNPCSLQMIHLLIQMTVIGDVGLVIKAEMFYLY